MPYRIRDGVVEVLIGHPGGPFWASKDDGAWSILKGEYTDGEDSWEAAQREFTEETGLAPADYRAGPDWDCVVSGIAVAMIRILDVDSSGDALRARIEANLARQHQPELAAIHLVRGRGDLTAAMPRFVTAFIERQFSA